MLMPLPPRGGVNSPAEQELDWWPRPPSKHPTVLINNPGLWLQSTRVACLPPPASGGLSYNHLAWGWKAGCPLGDWTSTPGEWGAGELPEPYFCNGPRNVCTEREAGHQVRSSAGEISLTP